MLGAGMILAATTSHAYAGMQVRLRFPDVRPVGLAAATLAISAVLLAGPAAATAPGSLPAAGTLGVLALLGAACTALAYVLFYALVKEVGAGRAAVITSAAPAVAVVLGVRCSTSGSGPGCSPASR